MPAQDFPQTREGITAALDFVEQAATSAGVSGDRLDRVVLVAGEVLGNVIEHGAETAHLRVHVGIEADDASLRLTIREAGRGVAIERVKAAALPGEPLATEGRGLFLIRTLADSVEALAPSGTRYTFRDRS